VLGSFLSLDDEARPLNFAAWSAAGPDLLLLHGVGRRWQDWLTVVPALAMRWNVWALDLRGHGHSARTPGAYRVIDYVEDVARFVTEHLERPAILVGHSLGSMVAAAVAARVPERILGVVLEDPTFEMTASRLGETSFPDVWRAFQAEAGSSDDPGTIARRLSVAPIGVPGQPGPVPLGRLRDAVSLRFSAWCLQALDPEALVTPLAGRWLDGYDVAATLNAVGCPTLLLQGEFALGGALPDAYAQELAGAIPDVTPLKLADVGHNIHGTQPEAFLRVVVPFLATLEPSTRGGGRYR
jgi:pimeloyl-ACP methyl ester carboxylesterase